MAYYQEADKYGGVSDPFADSSTMAFSDVSIRAGFIRKVYSILLCQLAVTIAFICFFLYCEPVKHYALSHPGLFYGAFFFHTKTLIQMLSLPHSTEMRAVTFVTMIAMACCEGVRRTFPTNLIFLTLFTICEGYLLGAVSSVYNKDEVLIAVGITTVVVLGITLFAFQTKYDFTMMGGFLFVALIVLICFGFLAIFFHNRVVNIVYASLGALLFALYLVYDTQIMMGGGKMYAISPEEYIFAALNLYLDIINMFLYILQLVSAASGNR